MKLYNLSDKLDTKEENNENTSNIIKSINKNALTNISNKSNNSFNSFNDLKNLKFINQVNTWNYSSNSSKILKSHGININTNEKSEIPILVINDNVVNINDNMKDIYNRTSYDSFMNYMNHFKNKDNTALINNNELKNIILFGDFSEKIEKKLNYKILKKTRNYILKRKKFKTPLKREDNLSNLSEINFKLTPFNSEKNILNNNRYSNYFKKNLSRNIKDIKHIIKNSNNQNKKFKEIIINKRDKLNDKNNISDKKDINTNNKTFSYQRKERHKINNFLFKNPFLNENLSSVFLFEDKGKDNNDNDNNDNNKKVYPKLKERFLYLNRIKNMKKRNEFIQTPNSFLSSFQIFKRKMRKLNII